MKVHSVILYKFFRLRDGFVNTRDVLRESIDVYILMVMNDNEMMMIE